MEVRVGGRVWLWCLFCYLAWLYKLHCFLYVTSLKTSFPVEGWNFCFVVNIGQCSGSSQTTLGRYFFVFFSFLLSTNKQIDICKMSIQNAWPYPKCFVFILFLSLQILKSCIFLAIKPKSASDNCVIIIYLCGVGAPPPQSPWNESRLLRLSKLLWNFLLWKIKLMMFSLLNVAWLCVGKTKRTPSHLST